MPVDGNSDEGEDREKLASSLAEPKKEERSSEGITVRQDPLDKKEAILDTHPVEWYEQISGVYAVYHPAIRRRAEGEHERTGRSREEEHSASPIGPGPAPDANGRIGKWGVVSCHNEARQGSSTGERLV